MKKLFSLLVLILLCASAHAQQDGNVVVYTGNTINCVTQEGEKGFAAKSWSIGGTVSDDVATMKTSLPALRDLVITKTFDACSQQLIHSFLLGSALSIPTLTLTQYSAATGTARPIALLTLTLTDALINLYTVSGAPNVNPVETLNFTYKKMCITSVSVKDGASSLPVTVCYDRSQNKIS